MEKKELAKELEYLLKRAVLLNISAYLISAFFIGFTLSFALGLALGTAGLFVNLLLLNNSIKNIVDSGGHRAQQRMFSGYLVRIAAVSAVTAAAMVLPFVNVIGAVIPYFYPNVVYAGKALLRKGDKTE